MPASDTYGSLLDLRLSFFKTAVCKQTNSRATADATMYSNANRRQMFDVIL